MCVSQFSGLVEGNATSNGRVSGCLPQFEIKGFCCVPQCTNSNNTVVLRFRVLKGTWTWEIRGDGRVLSCFAVIALVPQTTVKVAPH